MRRTISAIFYRMNGTLNLLNCLQIAPLFYKLSEWKNPTQSLCVFWVLTATH